MEESSHRKKDKKIFRVKNKQTGQTTKRKIFYKQTKKRKRKKKCETKRQMTKE